MISLVGSEDASHPKVDVRPKMDSDTATAIHRRFGIFRYSEALSECGVVGPSEQICAIAGFVTGRLPSVRAQVTESDSHEESIAFMDRAVREWAQSAGPEAFLRASSIEDLQLRVADDVKWDLCRDFAELLNFRCGREAYSKATWKLRNLGYAPEFIEVLGIAEHFVDVVLPSAVRIFDLNKGAGREVSWLSIVFYRAALRGVISDRERRAHLRLLEYRHADFGWQPDSPEEVTLTGIVSAIEKLGASERTAIELYFGFDGTERTQEDISRVLGCSEYRARSTIIRGLARLAAFLRVNNGLSTEESNVMNLVFGEGISVSETAKELRLPVNKVREDCGRIATKFRTGLRVRTTASKRVHAVKGDHMASTALIVPPQTSLNTQTILECLRGMRGTPSFRVHDGKVEVELGAAWYLYDQVQQVAKDEYVHLQNSRQTLDWLVVPQSSRTDSQSGKSDDEILRSLSRSSWNTAAVAFEKLRQLRPDRFPDARRERTIHALYKMFSSVSFTIEATLTQSMRRNGIRILQLTRNGKSVKGNWQGDSSVEVDFLKTVFNASSLIDLLCPYRKRLAFWAGTEIFKDVEFGLPGFVRSPQTLSHVVSFERLPPSVKGRVDYFNRAESLQIEGTGFSDDKLSIVV